MTLPATIRTAVSSAAIKRVTRLFNGSVSDVLNELLQNARRAGATRVDIETLDLAGHPTLAVCDDGHGIDDPALLVTLGQSGWADDTCRREDPAGMGIFSLAGHRVEIRSYSRTAQAGWQVVIPADAWESSAELVVKPFPHDAGTEILIDLPESWEAALDAAAAACARYFPLAVSLNGQQLTRSDFLAGARYIETSDGCRIGVFDRPAAAGDDAVHINFHGVALSCRLPAIAEINRLRSWSALIDIVDAPDLQLVLPARKEMVQNTALDALRLAVETALFRAIANEDKHQLAFKDWQRAETLGISLPEAARTLPTWTPRTADHNGGDLASTVEAANVILCPRFEPDIEQNAALALGKGTQFEGRLVRGEPQFQGYRWYDNLPRVVSLVFLIDIDGSVHFYGPDAEAGLPEGLSSGTASSIDLHLGVATCGDADADKVTQIVALPILVCANDSHDLDEALIFVAKGADVSPGALAWLIEASVFCADEDHDCDSWETQNEWFVGQARELANTLLFGEEHALLERIRDLIFDKVASVVPAGRTLTSSVTNFGVTLALSPPEPS